MSEKLCLNCGEAIIGRSDKKYCDDQCRSAFFNKTQKKDVEIINLVNKELKKNHRILKELNPNGKTKVRERELTNAGFNFNYHTSVFRTKTNKEYVFCYDQGYLKLENAYYALVEKQDWV